MDQSLVQVEDQQLVEACFFELEGHLVLWPDRWKLFYLLDDVYGLDYLH